MSEQKASAGRRARNLGLAAVAAQAGCWTILIVFVALFLGLWLDSLTGQRGLFVFGLVIISIPVSLMVMLRIALSAINRIDPPGYVNAEHESSSDLEEV